jgi:hypothetical protein
VTPEPHGAQRRVVGATSIGKIKGHGPGTASKPPSLTLRASSDAAGAPIKIGNHGPMQRVSEVSVAAKRLRR